MRKWVTLYLPVAATVAALVAALAGLGAVGMAWFSLMDDQGRHLEAMEAQADDARADQRRHLEAMEALADDAKAERNRHEEALDDNRKRHAEAMEALKALIRNTAPPDSHTSRTGRRPDGVDLAIRPGE